MKKLFTLIAVLVGYLSVAQNIPPQAINFQGVAIDKNGIPVPGMDELGDPIQNSAIRVRFSILTGTATGTISYQEEHITTTDEFGRFNLEIGRGTATNGVFSAINWGGDKHFLQVEVDLSALGTNYTLASVQEFLSVPYALYAKSTGSSENDFDTDPTNEIQTLSLTGNLLEISMGNSVTLPPNTDSQTLSIVGSTLTISGGNSVVIPDAQTLSINGTALSISNGNTVNLPADSDNQTLSLNGSNLSISGGNTISLPQSTDSQTLSISGNQLSISNGNNINLPISIDNDTTNELQSLSINNGVISISKGNSISMPIITDNQTLTLSGSNLSISGGNTITLPSIPTLSLSGSSLSINGGNSVILPFATMKTDTIFSGRNFFGFVGNTNGGNFAKTGPVDTIYNVAIGSTVKVFFSISGVAYPTGSNGTCGISVKDLSGNNIPALYTISGSKSLNSSINLNMSQMSYNIEIEFPSRNTTTFFIFASASGFNQGGNTRGITINTPIWQYAKVQ